MRRLLLATVLLSTVMSDDNMRKNRYETSSPIFEKEIWSRREKRAPRRDAVGFDFDEFSNTQVFTTPIKLSPLTVARQLDSNGRHLKYKLSDDGSGDLGCRIVNPTVLMSVDFRDLLEKDDQIITRCNTEPCYRINQSWEMQKPLYVEEPSWIEIENDYVDTSSQHLDVIDPFVLSRGKKIYRWQDSIADTEEKSLLDYSELLGIRDRTSKPLMTRFSRKKRSISPHKFEGKRNGDSEKDMKKKDDEKSEARKGGSYIDNLRRYEDPFFLTRGKKMGIQNTNRRPNTLKNYFNHRQENGFFTMRRIRNGKRSVNFEPNSKKQLFQGIVDETLKNRSANLTVAKETQRNYQPEDDADIQTLYASSEEGNTLRNGKQLKVIRREGQMSSAINSRVRRNNYKDLRSKSKSLVKRNIMMNGDLADAYDQWYENVRDMVDASNYLERRDKHSDLLDLLEQPYFISRGKKSSGEHNSNASSRKEEGEVKYESLLKNIIIRQILNRLIESLKCSSEECIEDLSKMVKRKTHRDRRGALDELLTKYDPFYVARGKRTNAEDSLAKRNSNTDPTETLHSFLNSEVI